jgi:hypothetical protein
MWKCLERTLIRVVPFATLNCLPFHSLFFCQLTTAERKLALVFHHYLSYAWQLIYTCWSYSRRSWQWLCHSQLYSTWITFFQTKVQLWSNNASNYFGTGMQCQLMLMSCWCILRVSICLSLIVHLTYSHKYWFVVSYDQVNWVKQSFI